MKSPLFITRNKNRLEISISPIEDWDGFDKLIQYMIIQFSVTIIESIDGPGSRRWILELDGHQFELIHDDGYGNYLLAPTKDSEAIILKIADDLEERLADL